MLMILAVGRKQMLEIRHGCAPRIGSTPIGDLWSEMLDTHCELIFRVVVTPLCSTNQHFSLFLVKSAIGVELMVIT